MEQRCQYTGVTGTRKDIPGCIAAGTVSVAQWSTVLEGFLRAGHCRAAEWRGVSRERVRRWRDGGLGRVMRREG